MAYKSNDYVQVSLPPLSNIDEIKFGNYVEICHEHALPLSQDLK